MDGQHPTSRDTPPEDPGVDWQSHRVISAIWDTVHFAAQHIVVIDMEGCIRHSNATPQLQNRDIGTSIYEHLPPESHELARAALKKLRDSDEVQQYEVPAYNEHREPTWYACRLVPLIIDGCTHGATILAADIGPQRRAEDGLREEQERLRQQLQIQERDRRLLAHEIHDGMLQDIIGAQMLLESIFSQSPDDQIGDAAATIRRTLNRAVEEGRRLIGEIRPMMMDEDGLTAAIQYLIKEEEAYGTTTIEFQADPQIDEASPIMAGTVYRIVQESLANARKHSGASRVVCQVRHSDSKIIVDIRDDGCGFDPTADSRSGLGLRGIRERARLFDGHATIASESGLGTHIHVEMPLVAPG